MTSPSSDILASPVTLHDIEALQKAKLSYQICMNEGELLNSVWTFYINIYIYIKYYDIWKKSNIII